MSAILSIGEANHVLLNADAEIRQAMIGLPVVACGPRTTLAAARAQLLEARATLAAVRLALNSPALADALAHHQEMARTLREAARLAHMPPGRGLYLRADEHGHRARALHALVGAEPLRM